MSARRHKPGPGLNIVRIEVGAGARVDFGSSTPLRPVIYLKIYTFYIDDDRYSVSSLDAVTAPSDHEALTAANARVGASRHYRAIEVFDDDRPVGRVGHPDR